MSLFWVTRQRLFGNFRVRPFATEGAKKGSTESEFPCLTCPSCHTCFRFGLASTTCPSCGTKHEAGQAVDYFALLGVRRNFHIDIKAAETQYKRMQFVVHPDRNSANTAENPPDYCALLNEAIATLKNPLKRVEHLLKLHGIHETSETDRVQDMDLLMEIMEVNEAIDDAVKDRQALEKLLASLEAKTQVSEQRIASLYDENKLEDVKKEADKMRFFVRTIERVQELLRY